ncbi:MAG TPA: YggS family pyridoxal phosphate-dependent enzyme [Rhodospirillaceae bacterium]|nr:YggS family pyridoxal phosphate-dependent enzyme [Magnetovibrio sp.]HBT41398.1 YggS family pyridoxal phosphate-dependent enzyme [Rhodospirillaceae bacterium]HCS70210.1 YggS family pyridoxal phosphate-dependent enzyme [Rhodospirillaceae bacterium]|tara:strand:- start:3339 stop:4046 length:708 start_codon:yes stop_codon:yes gene_type:complete
MIPSDTAPHSADPDIAANLAEVQAKVAEAARAAGRDPAAVTLVAVGKTFPADHMLPALNAGQRAFGENRVQEAEEKWPGLRTRFPDLRLHLIGPLQSNKVRKAVDVFDVIETVDRPKLARALANVMAETGRRPDCFIQVNTGAEDQKAGVLPQHADAFIAQCRDDFALPVTGLMCIPPVDEEPSLHFQLLAEIAKRNGLAQLSMGMSADYEIAVAFGATHVRVGSAIFGTRPKPA